MADIGKNKNEQENEATANGILVKKDMDSNVDSPDISALKSLFSVALETRNFEISMLVQRNNFFMIFQGVLLAGLIQSVHSKPIVSFMVCLAGFLVSGFQVKMASGAKFWQEYWEEALGRIEEELLKTIHSSGGRTKTIRLFHDKTHIYENMVKERLNNHGYSFIDRLIMRRYSVSRVPIYVAIVLAVIWFSLVLCTLRAYAPFSIPSFIVGF